MSVATIERPVYTPDSNAVSLLEPVSQIINVETTQTLQEKAIVQLGSMALRRAEVHVPEDLCDLSGLYHSYDTFIQTIEPRIEHETVIPEAGQHKSLYDMLYGAAEGNAEARAGVQMNAETIVAETLCKDGSILHVDAAMSEDGQIIQFGQTTRDRQRKTLEWYPDQSSVLRANTLVEGRNASVIEHLWQEGHLKGRKVLEISLVPKSSTQELFDYGYFLDRMTAIVRLTTISETGKVAIESGLVGGVDQDVLPQYKMDEMLEDEMERYDKALDFRFDDEIAGEMLEMLGVGGTRKLDTTEKLGTVVVLPGDVDILDIVQLWDRLASAKLNKPVFFGLRSLYKEHVNGRMPTREDYEQQRQRSQKQQADLKVTAQKVAQETIARRSEARNDLQAIRLLAEISKNHTTRYVIERPTIDARVIVGREAAVWAAEAQWRFAMGDITGAETFATRAQATARPTGCPTGGSASPKEKAEDRPNTGIANKEEPSEKNKKSSNKKEKGSKREWMYCVHCPLCDRDGVDAYIDYYPAEKKKRITCCSCRGHKEYKT